MKRDEWMTEETWLPVQKKIEIKRSERSEINHQELKSEPSYYNLCISLSLFSFLLVWSQIRAAGTRTAPDGCDITKKSLMLPLKWKTSLYFILFYFFVVPVAHLPTAIYNQRWCGLFFNESKHPPFSSRIICTLCHFSNWEHLFQTSLCSACFHFKPPQPCYTAALSQRFIEMHFDAFSLTAK